MSQKIQKIFSLWIPSERREFYTYARNHCEAFELLSYQAKLAHYEVYKYIIRYYHSKQLFILFDNLDESNLDVEYVLESYQNKE